VKLRLGTRGSDLALTQSESIAAALTAHGADIELVVISTAGDRSQAASFIDIGPQGVFVREIEQALLEHRIDLAVHSYKDLPSTSPAELVVAAVPAREDAADVLVLRRSAQDSALPLGLRHGATVGTASVRRQVWLGHYRPDLVVKPLRGNVPTRLQRLREGRFDAILLAAAGLARLADGPHGERTRAAAHGLLEQRLDPTLFVPAPSQGALAVQCRAADTALRARLAALDHAPTRATVAAERALLGRVQGGCDVAFGCHCAGRAGSYEMWSMLERDGVVQSFSATGDAPLALAEQHWQYLQSTPADAAP
jgi:hydroxymethylbilane synthase